MILRYSLGAKLEPSFVDFKRKFEAWYSDYPEVRFWHRGRTIEYPWAISAAPPKGLVLDVGSNLQFSLSLIANGHSVTIHHTDIDLDTFGVVNGVRLPLADFFEEHRHQFPSIVVGYPSHLNLRSRTFDVIYVLSTLEHVEPDRIRSWILPLWNLLAENGLMCITVDWYLSMALGAGYPGHGYNHDFKRLAEELSAAEILYDEDTPWNMDYARIPMDDDIIVTVWNEYHDVVTYGFVLRKAVS